MTDDSQISQQQVQQAAYGAALKAASYLEQMFNRKESPSTTESNKIEAAIKLLEIVLYLEESETQDQ